MEQPNLDGIRRYEELVREIKATADKALSIAISGSLSGSEGAILDIAHGGTGSSVKTFVDTYSNQFDIDGSKIFLASGGFQLQSDIVDSDELSGNLRLISCTAQGPDIGPQLRFSGKFSDVDMGVFAFGTIAGRKYNGVSDDRSGYLQFSTTRIDGTDSEYHIYEAMRIDHEGVVGIGTEIPVKGLDNKLWVSNGDIFIDNVGGNRSFKIQISDESTESLGILGRMQAVAGLDAPTTSHLFLSNNVKFSGTITDPVCAIDDPLSGSAAIELRVNANSTDLSDSLIRFYTGDPGGCPKIRGQFFDGGFITFGDMSAGVENLVDAPTIPSSGGTSPGARGNTDPDNPKRVTADNVKFGIGEPEGIINAPIGAIYGNGDRNNSDSAKMFYVKTSDHYGPFGWKSINLGGGENNICVSSVCPDDPLACSRWFDTTNNILWYWDANAKRGDNPPGAWLSSNVYTLLSDTNKLTGSTDNNGLFRSNLKIEYMHLMPTHNLFNKANVSGRFDLYIEQMNTCWRVRNNLTDTDFNKDHDKNYYIVDLISLSRMQGAPYPGYATRNYWPGDRTTYADSGAATSSGENVQSWGHTFHPNLPMDLIKRALPLPPHKSDGTPKFVQSSTVDVYPYSYNPSLPDDYFLNAPNNSNPSVWYAKVASDMTNNTIIPIDPTSFTSEFPACLISKSGSINDSVLNFRPSSSANVQNPGFILQVVDGAFAGVTKVINRLDGSISSPNIQVRKKFDNLLTAGTTVLIYPVEYKRSICRCSTRGNGYPSGPYDNDTTRDIQPFIETGSNATGVIANPPGGYPLDPFGFPPIGQTFVPINYYMPLSPENDGSQLDAIMLSLLWNVVGQPGKVEAVVSISYRLALPYSSCGGTA